MVSVCMNTMVTLMFLLPFKAVLITSRTQKNNILVHVYYYITVVMLYELLMFDVSICVTAQAVTLVVKIRIVWQQIIILN